MFDFILHAKQTLAVTTAKLRDVLVLVANRKHEIRHCVDHLHCDGKRCMPRAQEDVKQKRALYVRHTFLPAYARPRCIECAVPFMSVVISAAVCATLAVLLWKQRERGNRWNCARFSRHGGAELFPGMQLHTPSAKKVCVLADSDKLGRPSVLMDTTKSDRPHLLQNACPLTPSRMRRSMPSQSGRSHARQ